MITKPARRIPCEFCARKFADDLARDRHSKQIHRKAFNLVKELREELKQLNDWIRAQPLNG